MSSDLERFDFVLIGSERPCISECDCAYQFAGELKNPGRAQSSSECDHGASEWVRKVMAIVG